MGKQFLRSRSKGNIGSNRMPGLRVAGLVIGILSSIVLPFCLLDEFHCLSFPGGAHNSIFTNAVRFYSGDDITITDPKRYIAIVTYIGLSEDGDLEAMKSSVDKIIHNQVMPAFERKGLQFNRETNEITDVRLFYNRESSFGSQADVKVFCFVTSMAAFALVVV